MNNLRSFPLCMLASVLICSGAALAQQAAPAVRIVSPIDESNLVTLKGNTLPVANAKNDQGGVSASLPMTGLVLVLSRNPEQQAAFDAFVASQYESSSPNFHQWLTPRQIGAQFGPAPADISTLTGWLAGHGFAVKSTGADGMSIQFSGTAGQVESAFHTEIHILSVNGKGHIANMSDPQIPAALAPVVLGVKGLHNFLPRPLHRVGSKVHFNPDAHGWVKPQFSSAAGFTAGTLRTQAKSASTPRPGFYFPYSGSSSIEEDVAPYDFAAIYNLPSAWPNTTSGNGSGQIITIIGTSDIYLPDVANFKSAFGLPAGLTPVIAHGLDGDPGICSGSSNACNGGDLDENSLDVEWSGAVAPGAQIVLVTDAYNSQNPLDVTNDAVFDGAQWAIDNAYVTGSAVYGSHILSISYGLCELLNGTASNVLYNNLWETAAGSGIAVFVATGDSGSPACDDGGDANGNPYEAQYGLSVSGLASSPYDTAVGGTDFTWCQPTIVQSGTSAGSVQGCAISNATSYWNTSNGTHQQSAKGYVPETPWNDTCENPINATFMESIASYIGAGTYSTPEEACNFVYNDSLGLYFVDGEPALMEYVDTVGGSGGASNCVVSNGEDTSSCSSSTTSTGSSYGNLPLANDGWPVPPWQSGVTGTSGLTARAIPDVSFFAGNGNFDSATLICVSNDGASCTSISETGGDIANGLGTDTSGAEEVGGTSVATPEMAGVMALINQKAGAAQGLPNAELYDLAGKQTYPRCSSEGGSTSNGCYFNDINQGTNAMPCAPSTSVLEGGATYDYNTGDWIEFPAREHAVQASPNCNIVNSGDVIGTLSGFSATIGYDEATGLGSLNIANVVSASGVWTAVAGVGTAAVSINLSGVTSIDSNQSLGVTVGVSAVSPAGTPTGSVTLTASANGFSSTQTLPGGTPTFTIPANTFTSTGSVTLTAYYSGDSTYAAATSQNASVTVTYITRPSFTLNSITSPAAVAPGATASATASVQSSSGYAGTVTLICSLSTTGLPSGAMNLPSCTANQTIPLSASTTSGNATLDVTTTAPVTTTFLELHKPGGGKGLLGMGGGAVLALVFFFGIPARRRSWRSMLGILVAMVALGLLSSCGGGGSSSPVNNNPTVSGTTAGTYTFTVTAIGAPSNPSTQTQTFKVTVN